MTAICGRTVEGYGGRIKQSMRKNPKQLESPKTEMNDGERGEGG